MRIVIQRVSESSVTIDGKVKSSIRKGLLILLGIEDTDTDEDIKWLCQKIVNLRIFPDENGVMNKWNCKQKIDKIICIIKPHF